MCLWWKGGWRGEYGFLVSFLYDCGGSFLCVCVGRGARARVCVCTFSFFFSFLFSSSFFKHTTDYIDTFFYTPAIIIPQ